MDSSIKSYRLLSKTANTIDSLSKKVLAPYGLNCNEFAILEILYQEGCKNIYQIAQEIKVASSSMTYLIDKLEEKECIERRASVEDRRAMDIKLTPTGKQLMDDIFPEYKEKIEEAFTCFTKEDEENEFITLLEKLDANLNRN